MSSFFLIPYMSWCDVWLFEDTQCCRCPIQWQWQLNNYLCVWYFCHPCACNYFENNCNFAGTHDKTLSARSDWCLFSSGQRKVQDFMIQDTIYMKPSKWLDAGAYLGLMIISTRENLCPSLLLISTTPYRAPAERYEWGGHRFTVEFSSHTVDVSTP